MRAVDESTVYGDAFAALKAGRTTKRAWLRALPHEVSGRARGPTMRLLARRIALRREGLRPAQKSFQAVLDNFPDSRKAADAMLKIGYCQYELKAFRNARTTLERVVSTYPGTESARLAEQRLTKLDVEGR